MPRILISGYYGFDNLGDDTVLFGIMSAIRKLRPDAELGVLSNQPKRTRELFGIPAYNRWSLPVITRELMRSDLLVMGGGSLLQDVSSPRSVIYYLGIVALAKLFGKPVVFYAQGIGPVNRPFSKKLIRQIVNKVDLITVRDDKSFDDLKKIGVHKPPIHVTADPALSIDTTLFPKENGREILKEFGVTFGNTGTASKPVAGIAIRNWNTSHPYKKVLAEACDRLSRRGWQVVFIPMQYPGDVRVSAEVISLMQEPAVLLDRQFSFRDISSIIANMQMIVGMRLHSLILAALYGIPFVPLSYDPKIDRFVHRLGLPQGERVTSVTVEGLNQQIEKVEQNLDKIKLQMAEPLNLLRREAEKSGEFAVKFLK
ncbi:polysaccharide pyruvyl transferase CsaB [Effusibacillus lacus]|uniref:Polysaccharide pyruvyl transferase n=1 Tax=Effusibacillus lacus TaxID=1348429 RepID=A0A292YIC8_9BACL|nr:polysaccharide pyruvyl transferase CsaB [Effusibacillus lacus]TCS69773.1 polysaccharide pyruvyl transferase CsaB [Effusibacillus lacus]GAX88856.1 polysaccharide pyruvyl transferase [Effusibacillus lacus]